MRSAAEHLCEISFQFPTGWNSTVGDVYINDENASFNSQRDGILQRHRQHYRRCLGVSIPNGMEFYP